MRPQKTLTPINKKKTNINPKDSKPIKSDKRHSSNKGRSKSSAYWLDKGFIRVSCQDWDEDTKIQDSLVVSVVLEELNIFFDKNYK